jgi:ribosomal-protein-alanine N-acetyltransferase
MRNLLTAETIFDIEQACFPEPWSLEMVKTQLNSANSATVIKTENGVPAGYATGIKLGADSELYRIAVLPQYRNQGIAKELLTRFLEKCGGECFLEVRSKNTAAIGLYESTGFTEIGRRKGYYGDDDALVYRKAKA